MDVRLALCLLWALLATASARPSSCYRRLHGQSSQVERRCRFWEDSCITVQEENSYDGSVHRGVFQSCINSLMSLEGQMDFEFGDGIYLRVRSELCRETNCNTGELKDRPKLSTVPNGRQCPSCYALGSHRCLQDDTLRCQGAANQCVDVVGTLLENENTEIPFAARGCATKDVGKIEAGAGLISGIFIYRIKSIQLSPAPWVETEDRV